MVRINSKKNATDVKINIEKNEIKNKLGNSIKSNSISGIKSATVGKIKNVNFGRAVGSSRVTLRKSNSNINSSNVEKGHSHKSNSRIKTIKKNGLNNSYKNNKSNSRIKTIKRNYLSNSIEEDDVTKNNGVNSITTLKRGISKIDEKIRQTTNGIKTGKRIAKTSIKTSKVAIQKAKSIKNKIKKLTNGKIKINKRTIAKSREISKIKNGKLIVNSPGKSIKKPGKILYKNAKEEIKTSILEEKNNDLAIQGIIDSTNNAHTMIETGRRINNCRIKINNHYKNKNKGKEYSKIQTKRSNNNINTKVKSNIHTKNTTNGVKTKSNKQVSEKLRKKRTKGIQIRKKMKEVAEKVYKEVEIIVKKVAASVAKSKLAMAIAIGSIIVFFISCLASVSGIFNVSVSCVPNICDPDKWKTEMNRIEAEANRTISSADRFCLEGNSNADWKDVIAVYMAKYENELPENFGIGNSNDVNSSGSVTVGSSTETKFTGTYADIIKEASEKYGVDFNLIAAIIKQESDFNPNDVSSAGAMGLMQLMPETAASVGVSNPFDPYQNIMGGTQLLQELCEMYNNNLTLVLIGYNWGQGNIQEHGVTDSNYLSIVPAETRNYIPIIMANYESFKNGTQLPDTTVTGIVDSTGNSNELSKIYYLFNTLKISKSNKTVKHKDGSESKKTIKTVTLQKNDTDYVMKKLNFNEDQKEMVKATLEADAFKEVIPDFDFKFKIRGANNSTENVEIGTGGSIGTGTAVTDEQFGEITKHIEECLGTPYVMGGTQPGVALDCSAFVSYVFTKTGAINGRYTAQGLCDISTKVNENELKPGDLIFFQGTYDCGDAVSHVGIYVGNGMMAHSGRPCQYSSFNTAYWQEHLYGYGRLT